MAAKPRQANLRSRTSRQKFAKERRHYLALGDGLVLVYRRTAAGFGTWSAKLPRQGGGYALRVLGEADDVREADGVKSLSFAQAQKQALALAEAAETDPDVLARRDFTVAQAAEDYLEWFKSHRRDYRGTAHAVRVHILPKFGERQVASLRTGEIRKWVETLGASPARVRTGMTAKKQRFREAPKTAEEKRARRSTANRILTVFKAILNRAFVSGRVPSDRQWRNVKPFPQADSARIRFLTDAEAARLVNACPPDLRDLVRAALLTGARFGEVAALAVHDVDLKNGLIRIAESKSGRPRHVPLNDDGLEHFRRMLTGKTGAALVFTKASGSAWGKNHHVKALTAACKVAKIEPAVAFHELRHTYASHLAQAGVELLTIAKLLGHADTRITARHYAHLSDKTLSEAVKKLPSFKTASALEAVEQSAA